MKRDRVFKLLNWGLLAASIIISIVTYKYLPAKVATHIGLTGKLSNYVDKGLVAVGIPAFVLIFNLYSSFMDKEERGGKLFFINLVIIAAHMFLTYTNM
jgi:uncharacterized membrane protein